MSAPPRRAIEALAFQLAAAVEQYESHVDQLIDRWLDMDCYQTVSADIDEIQLYSSSLPQIAVQAVALLIAHSELIFSLWRHRDSSAQPGELEDCQRRHRACVADLRRSCLRFLRSDGSGRLTAA
jgi:hypothetical protein